MFKLLHGDVAMHKNYVLANKVQKMIFLQLKIIVLVFNPLMTNGNYSYRIIKIRF